MEIVIRDDYEREVYRGKATEAGRLEADVRIGDHVLTASHPAFEAVEEVVTIDPEGTTQFLIRAVGKRGTLKVVGPPGARAFVKGMGESPFERVEKIPDGGEVVFPRVPPGDYEVRTDREGQAAKKITVEAASEAVVEFPK
jgi:hypothetical protein